MLSSFQVCVAIYTSSLANYLFNSLAYLLVVDFGLGCWIFVICLHILHRLPFRFPLIPRYLGLVGTHGSHSPVSLQSRIGISPNNKGSTSSHCSLLVLCLAALLKVFSELGSLESSGLLRIELFSLEVGIWLHFLFVSCFFVLLI